jgi:hypothetical protein
VARCFQELASAPNCRLEKLVQEDTADNSANTNNWDTLRITQCLELSLAETPKNESLLIAACHFFSNGINAFLFGHGPMPPTLADVYMMTGLDITGPMYPFQYKSSTRQKGVKTGSGY